MQSQRYDLPEIFASFSELLPAHLISELQYSLALSRFLTPQRPFDLDMMALAADNKPVGVL